MTRARPNLQPAARRRRPHRRRGIAIVYVMFMWAALVGFCSLAVDYGRVQMVKGQLQCVSDAAARAAVLNLPNGATAAQQAAVTVAAANTVDGASVTISPSTDLTFGYWDAVTQTFTALTPAQIASANAVQVTAHRTAAGGNGVPLTFASILGQNSCDAHSLGIACHAENVPLVNASFEQPQIGYGNYVYCYPMPGWTLTGDACLETYGSAWGGPQPDGTQAVSLQCIPGSTQATIRQTFHAIAGTYSVSFLSAMRSYYTGSTPLNPVSVTIDGTVVATISPASYSFQTYTTPPFTLTTGSHTIALAATNTTTGDCTSFVDDVAINAVSGSVLLAK